MNVFVAESSIGCHIPVLKDMDAKLISFTFRPSFHSLVAEMYSVEEQVSVRIKLQKALRIGGVENPLELLSDIYQGDIIELIKDFRLKNKEGIIYLGQDSDTMGHIMASILYYHLIERGVPKEKIVRQPLTAYGYKYNQKDGQYEEYVYKADGEFIPYEKLLEILSLDQKEQRVMHTGNPIRMGFRNLFSLEHIYNRSREYMPEVMRLSGGTSNATYITKWAIEERK